MHSAARWMAPEGYAYPRKEQGRAANLALLADTAEPMPEDDPAAAPANIPALISFYLDGINWAGFYIPQGREHAACWVRTTPA
jgi:putative methionine-R-sulfoxide reductase with GAF domain